MSLADSLSKLDTLQAESGLSVERIEQMIAGDVPTRFHARTIEDLVEQLIRCARGKDLADTQLHIEVALRLAAVAS